MMMIVLMLYVGERLKKKLAEDDTLQTPSQTPLPPPLPPRKEDKAGRALSTLDDWYTIVTLLSESSDGEDLCQKR